MYLRFHQLTEFDHGKRSCRRRLAGHNERRRKPPPGSLLASRLGHLSSSLFGDNTTKSGFLLDFSSYSRESRHSERDLWLGSKTSKAVSGCHTTYMGKFHHNLWPGNSEDPPPEMYLQGSAGGASFTIPSGECITGVSSDSTCALSLLSNQTWGSRNGTSNTDLGYLMNHGGAPLSSQPTPTQTVTVAHLPTTNSSFWNFKDIEIDQNDHLGIGQSSHPLNSGIHGDLFMEIDHSSGYNLAAVGQVHWSL